MVLDKAGHEVFVVAQATFGGGESQTHKFRGELPSKIANKVSATSTAPYGEGYTTLYNKASQDAANYVDSHWSTTTVTVEGPRADESGPFAEISGGDSVQHWSPIAGIEYSLSGDN